MADYGDEICEYILQLASASTANATNTAANVQTKDKFTLMETEIKKTHRHQCLHGQQVQ
jgi:hypothetical protein